MTYLEFTVSRSKYCRDKAISLLILGSDSAKIDQWIDSGVTLITACRIQLSDQFRSGDLARDSASRITGQISRLAADLNRLYIANHKGDFLA